MSKKETVKELEQRLLVAKKIVERALDTCKKIEKLLIKAKAEEAAEEIAREHKAAVARAKAEEAKIKADKKSEMVDHIIASYGKEVVEDQQPQDPKLSEETPEIPAEDPVVTGDISNEPLITGSDETPKVLNFLEKIKEIGEKPFLEVIGLKNH
jgi:iron-sulfur cluster repair protein YtfE (RIC family)